jgi:hypothetical protein
MPINFTQLKQALGCLSCNEWSDSAGNLVRLSVEDLTALHALREAKRLSNAPTEANALGDRMPSLSSC